MIHKLMNVVGVVAIVGAIILTYENGWIDFMKWLSSL
jgi:hypothetical protein